MVRLKNGDILEIPLNNQYGNGYAKFINSKKTWNDNNIPDVLRIFNFYSVDNIINCSDLLGRDLLVAPLAIAGSNGIIKSGWRLICNDSITEDDKFLPDVKSGWPHLIPIPEKWVYYESLGNPEKMHFIGYEKIKNLEYSRVISINLIPFRITMELMKLQGKNIKKEYDKLNWLEEIEYNMSYSIRPYCEQNKNIRGRVLR